TLEREAAIALCAPQGCPAQTVTQVAQLVAQLGPRPGMLQSTPSPVEPGSRSAVTASLTSVGVSPSVPVGRRLRGGPQAPRAPGLVAAGEPRADSSLGDRHPGIVGGHANWKVGVNLVDPVASGAQAVAGVVYTWTSR